MTISRRDMLKYCGWAGAAAIGGSGQPAAAAQTARPPIGLALCIGLNSVDPTRYGGWKGVLRGCVPDAEFMSSIFHQPQAGGAAFKVRTLWDRPTAQAKQKSDDVGTLANVKKYIRRAALGTSGRAGLQAGDIFVVTYSGHGSQRQDFNGDEPDKKDETWCLYDGEMVDDERAELWTLFNPGVRIVVISDSCHSGTVSRAILFQDALLNEARDAMEYDMSTVRSRGLDRTFIDKEHEFIKGSIEKLSRRSRGPEDENPDEPSLFRQMPEWLRGKLDADADYISQARAQTANIPRAVAELQPGQLKTRILSIGACQDSQTAGDLANNGLFTARLKQVWNAKQFNSYSEFFSLILRLMPDNQKPNLDVFGQAEPNIEVLRPFAI